MERDDLVQLAKYAEQTERYEDMAATMKQVTELGGELNNEERNLLSVAYKNVVGPRRTSWRLISCILDKYEAEESIQRTTTGLYRDQVESELKKICHEVLVSFYLIEFW